jgi:hypothetical protein
MFLVLVMFILNDATTPSKFTNCFKKNDIIANSKLQTNNNNNNNNNNNI